MAVMLCGWEGNQGRNFGLKSGGTNSEGERGALGSLGERGGEKGGSIPSSTDSGVWESAMSSPSGFHGIDEAEGFIVIYTPQMASVDSRLQQIFHLFVLKSGGTLSLSPKSGVPVPIVPP